MECDVAADGAPTVPEPALGRGPAALGFDPLAAVATLGAAGPVDLLLPLEPAAPAAEAVRPPPLAVPAGLAALLPASAPVCSPSEKFSMRMWASWAHFPLGC